MKILLVHNHYIQPGGEDHVFAAEAEVLRAHGEDVRLYTVHNSSIASIGQLSLAKSTIWNSGVFRELTDIIGDFTPDLIHCHNTFPLISPAAYAAANRLGIPVVQTLHNFRLLCLNGMLMRGGRPCEDCVGRVIAWPGVVHRCYRQSPQASAVVATMLAAHRLRGTWSSGIATYVALTEFARTTFVRGGLPADRVVVKPNFLAEDPGAGEHCGRFALYVGRLSAEKGLPALLKVWDQLSLDMTLRVVGDGPLLNLASEQQANVEWLGWQPQSRVLALMRDAAFLVLPSEWYEGFPMVLLEAMASGLPVIASDLGSLAEIVQNGKSGLLVPTAASEAWADALRWAVAHQSELAAMGKYGRQLFEDCYTPEAGYKLLVEVYSDTLRRSRPTSRHP
jgi:glycosyltransferase involved in cell wall biosynthesis